MVKKNVLYNKKGNKLHMCILENEDSNYVLQSILCVINWTLQ